MRRVIQLGLWEMPDGKSGNWVMAVAPANKAVAVDASKVTEAPPKPSTGSGSSGGYTGGGSSRVDDDEIPF